MHPTLCSAPANASAKITTERLGRFLAAEFDGYLAKLSDLARSNRTVDKLLTAASTVTASGET